jgi:hypothetical protein
MKIDGVAATSGWVASAGGSWLFPIYIYIYLYIYIYIYIYLFICPDRLDGDAWEAESSFGPAPAAP